VLLLEVTLPGGPAWLAGTARQLPFGALPERLRGREALILQRPGEAPRRARTPTDNPVAEGRELELTARLDADGATALEGTERLLGATGAEIKDAFSRLDHSRLQAVVESLYAGALTGLSLTEAAVDGVDSPDATLTIRWRGRLPAAGRAAGEGMELDRVGMPVQLGRRLATLPARTQALVLPEAIAQTVRVRLMPAPGLVAAPGPALEFATPFGSYRRREWSEAGALCWEERVLVPQVRVAPADYPAFAAFAAAVDAAQAGGVVLVPAAGP
jgi:hypothetical protein